MMLRRKFVRACEDIDRCSETRSLRSFESADRRDNFSVSDPMRNYASAVDVDSVHEE